MRHLFYSRAEKVEERNVSNVYLKLDTFAEIDVCTTLKCRKFIYEIYTIWYVIFLISNKSWAESEHKEIKFNQGAVVMRAIFDDV